MQLTVITRPVERSYTDAAGYTWRYTVLPATADDVMQAYRAVGVQKLVMGDEPADVLAQRAVAYSKVQAIMSAQNGDGKTVGIDVDGVSKPVTDPEMLGHTLHALPGLAYVAGAESILLGQQVDGERGNSEPAPVSGPSTLLPPDTLEPAT